MTKSAPELMLNLTDESWKIVRRLVDLEIDVLRRGGVYSVAATAAAQPDPLGYLHARLQQAEAARVDSELIADTYKGAHAEMKKWAWPIQIAASRRLHALKSESEAIKNQMKFAEAWHKEEEEKFRKAGLTQAQRATLMSDPTEAERLAEDRRARLATINAEYTALELFMQPAGDIPDVSHLAGTALEHLVAASPMAATQTH